MGTRIDLHVGSDEVVEEVDGFHVGGYVEVILEVCDESELDLCRRVSFLQNAVAVSQTNVRQNNHKAERLG